MSNEESLSCEACEKRRQLGIDGRCADCTSERRMRPTPPIVGPDAVNVTAARKPQDRLILKLNILAHLNGAAYDALTEDQLDVLVEKLESSIKRHINYAVRSANFWFEPLGVEVELKKEI